MIVLDTSAVLAILWREPEADDFRNAIAEAEMALISTATLLECAVVCMRRKGPANVEELDRLLEVLKVTSVAFDDSQSAIARQAFETYRAGRHGLNFGDCFAYALAKARGLPLLFKGDDFAATDVKRAA